MLLSSIPPLTRLAMSSGTLPRAVQQHVSVAEQDAVMMMIRMTYFPENPATPVRFEHHAAFEREAAEKAVFRRAPVEE
jgi:hypothetical protein